MSVSRSNPLTSGTDRHAPTHTPTQTPTPTHTATPTNTPTATATPLVVPPPALSVSFGYDPLDRLTSATYSDGQGLTYGYDAAGNRLSENKSPGGTISYTYATDSNRLQTVNSLSQTYDANGNMIERNVTGTVWTQTFDGENRLTVVSGQGSVFSYQYDGDGNRVKQVHPDGTFTIYIAGLYEVTYSGTGALLDTKVYYAFAGKVVAMRDNSTLYYLHTDHLGSTRVVTGGTGRAVSLNAYYPFGASKYASGARPTDMDFTGQRLDGTGLNFYNARYYDSAIGRFISADTIVPGAGNSQAFNRYAYSYNNPLKFTDPTGHVADPKCQGQQTPDCGVDGYYGESNTNPPPQAETTPTPTLPTPTTPPPIPTPCFFCTYPAPPTPGPVYRPAYPEPQLVYPAISIEIDWSRVDKVDAAIDGLGLLANGVALAQPETAPVVETAGGIVEFAGTLKSAYELIRGDPSSMLLQQVTTQSERYAVIVLRTVRLVPWVGFVGNLGSLYMNLRPRVTIQWETK